MERTFLLLILIMIKNGFAMYIGSDTRSSQSVELIPEKYDLSIHINTENQKPIFHGSVTITVKCAKNTDTIILNSKKLKIFQQYVTVKLITGETRAHCTILKQDPLPDIEVHMISMKRSLEAGKHYELYMNYVMEEEIDLDEIMFYNYENDWERVKITRIVTKLALNGARQLFPCFDQINLKAKFNVEINHPNNVNAITNFMFKNKITYFGMSTTKTSFEVSNPLSTYSLAIALVDFMSKEEKDPTSKTPITIWSEKNNINEIDFISSLVLNAFQFYSDYLKAPYAFEKLDVIVIPVAENGDNEKYGFITLGKNTRLKAIKTNEMKNFGTALDVCFAMSHQWFGATVTISEWKENYFFDILASYFEKPCVQKIFINSNMDFFEARDALSFLQVITKDWDVTSRSIFISKDNFGWPTGFQIKTYHLVRMINYFLTDNNFRDGLTEYLNKFKHANASIEDMAKIFTMKAKNIDKWPFGVTVQQIMVTWMNSDEYPLISVTQKKDREIIIIKQKKFVLLGESDKYRSEDLCWTFSLSYKTKGDAERKNVEKREWFVCEDGYLEIPIKRNQDEWIIFNWELNGSQTFNEQN